MKRRVFISAFLVLVVGFSVFIYLKYYQKNSLTDDKKLIYNTQLGQWEEANKIDDPVDADRETILKNDSNQNGLHNNTILRAYFDKYDENIQELSVKYLVAFTQGIYKEAKLRLSSSQTIYCAPAVYIDPNNGQAHKCLPLGAETQGLQPWEEAPRFSGFSLNILKQSDICAILST